MQKVFSHSSLTSFESCPRKYHFRYIQKIPAESESIEGFVGKRVHEILERLHAFAEDGRIPSLERVLQRYRSNWEEQFDASRIVIVRAENTVEFYQQLGERCLEHYYRCSYPFDRDQILGLEKPIQFSLDGSEEYRVRGVIDRLSRAPDGVLEIHDYKTGRWVPRQVEIDRDRQLALYEIGVREELEERGEVRLVWHYLQTRQVRTSRRSPEELSELAESTRRLIDKLRSEREWETRTSRLCDWCEYRGICPAQSPGTAPAAVARGEAPQVPAGAPAEPPSPARSPSSGVGRQLQLL